MIERAKNYLGSVGNRVLAGAFRQASRIPQAPRFTQTIPQRIINHYDQGAIGQSIRQRNLQPIIKNLSGSGFDMNARGYQAMSRQGQNLMNQPFFMDASGLARASRRSLAGVGRELQDIVTDFPKVGRRFQYGAPQIDSIPERNFRMFDQNPAAMVKGRPQLTPLDRPSRIAPDMFNPATDIKLRAQSFNRNPPQMYKPQSMLFRLAKQRPGLNLENVAGKKSPLIQEASKYKSADEFIKAKQNKTLANFDEEAIKNIQSTRHELHSIDNKGVFNSENSEFGKIDNYIDEISDDIEKLNITGDEKEVAKKIRKYSNSEGGERKMDTDKDFDDFTDDEWVDYVNKAFREISNEKEKINDIIEDYLGKIDKKWDNYSLDDISDIRGGKTFKPSGYARARSVLGTGSDNMASEKYYDNELSQLTDIWNKANKRK